MNFEELLGPVDQFADILARAPVIRRGAVTGAPDDLLSVQDLDRLLWSRAIRAADVRVAAENSIIPPVEYSATAEMSGGVVADYAVPERVHRYFDAGATLIWPHLQRFQPALFALASSVADTVGAPTWVDGCLTPAGRMDLAIHDRPVELAMVQLTGTRRWRVWKSVAQHSDRYNFGDPETLGDPVVDTELEPGDVLYIPSHSPYVGHYGGNLSLHVSVTFRQPTWRVLMQRTVSELLMDHRFLDRPLLEGTESAQVTARRDDLVRMLEQIDPEAELDRLRQLAHLDEEPHFGVAPGAAARSVAGHFETMARADRVGLDDGVVLGEDCRIDASEGGAGAGTGAGGTVAVTVGSTTRRLPQELVAVLRTIERGVAPRPVGDLLSGLTGDPVRMARTLVRMGVLRVRPAERA